MTSATDYIHVSDGGEVSFIPGEMTDNRAEYEKYNPPNGWGDLDGALRCLKNWKAEIAGGEYEKYGGETAKAWEWDVLTNRWPIEALWFRW